MKTSLNTKEQGKKRYSFSVVAAIIFIFYAMSGSTSDRSMYISISLLFFWIITTLFSCDKAIIACFLKKETISLLIYIFFLFITGIFVGGPINTIKIIGQTFIYFSPLIIYSYYKNISYLKLKTVLVWSLYFGLYFIARSLLFYSKYLDAARKLASNDAVFGEIAIGGGYSLAYSVVILTVYVFDLIYNEQIKDKRVKILSISSLIIMTILVLSTKSTLTIIWLFTGLSCSILFKKSGISNHSYNKKNRITSKSVKKIIQITSFILIIIILIVYSGDFGKFIIRKTSGSNDVVAIRLRQLGYGLADGLESSDYLMMRMKIPLKSINTFMSSPIIGKGYEYGYVWTSSYPYLGGHGEWADILGSKGLVGSLLIFLIFLYSIKRERMYSKKYISRSYIMVFFILGLFNPIIVFQPMYVLFFVIPTISLLCFNKNSFNN